MKLLILSPSFGLTGGVANHYMGLAPFFKENITFCFYGRRPSVSPLLCLIPDVLHFIWLLIVKRPDAVIINPSFRSYQLKRDGFYLLLVKLFRAKVVTFFHGWDYSLQKRLRSKPKLVRWVYNKSCLIYVLCSDFKLGLEELGITSPILLNTTKVDDRLLADFEIKAKTIHQVNRILFLARAEKSKGLHIVMQAYKQLAEKYPNLELSVCGIGGYLDEAKRFAKENKLTKVTFYGNVSGKLKSQCFSEADIYVLPTEEEGMATSVLEAMAFGLPVITRPVGGVKDFFKEPEMGKLVPTFDVCDYVASIEAYVTYPEKVKESAHFNYEYAQKHFMASIVASNMENQIRNMIAK